MELHTINGVLWAMPDSVRAYHAEVEFYRDPAGTTARLAERARVDDAAFQLERRAARAAWHEGRQKVATAQATDPAAQRAAADAATQTKATLEAHARMAAAQRGAPPPTPPIADEEVEA